jgi:hypothetical protein
MRTFLAAMSAAILVALGATSIASAGGDPFTKSWSATDVDGSLLTLTFDGSGTTRTVTAIDSRATFCAGGAYEIIGAGTIVGNEIDVVGDGGCVGDSLGPVEAIWTYVPASDTLTDGSVDYHRGSRAREAFLGVWKTTDVDGSTERLTFRGSGLIREASFLDDLATSCDPVGPFAAEGMGTIGSEPGWGRYITVSLEGGCVGGAAVEIPDLMYRYDFDTDTLRGPLDLGGNEIFGTLDWHRG